MKEKQLDDTVIVNAVDALKTDETVENTAEFSVVKETTPIGKHSKKVSSLFRRGRKKIEEPAEEKAEEDVRVFTASEEQPISDTQEIAPDEPTRPIPELEQTQAIDDPDSDENEYSQKGTQMLLDGFGDETPKVDEQTDEERLRRVRREQIEDFSQKREQHIIEMQEQQEEGENRGDVVYPETPLETESPSSDDEQPTETSVETTESLAVLLHRCSTTLLFSVVLEVVLLLLTLVSAFSPVLSMGAATYLIVQLVLFTALCGINLPLLTTGFSRLFSGKATAASLVSLASIVTLIHTALQFLNTTDLANGTTPLLTGVCGLGVLLLSIAKRLETEQKYRTAVFASSKDVSTVYKRIDDPDLAEEIGRPAVAIGEPRVAFYRETKTVQRINDIADDSSLTASQMKWYLPIALGLSALVSLAYFALNGISSWQMTLTLFCTMLNVTAPALLIFAMQMALYGAARSAQKEGAVIAGYNAVSSLGDVHALAVDAMDIFPDHSVLLHGIKTFSGTRIDDAILDAASVSVRAGGPLSHVFRRMIQNKVDMLRDVDTLVYEQDMGLSGWVSGRRVLIGNRKLLDNHGIDIPSKDYEQRYAINGRQLVYLSIAGELSAMFVVSYVADPYIKERLSALTKSRVTLLVRTCDQNITESLISSTFDLNGFYVELLNAPAGRSFEGLVDGVSEAEDGVVVSDGRRCGLFRALTSCCRLRMGTVLFTVLQSVLALLLAVVVGFSALMNSLPFSPLYLVEVLLAAVLALAFGAFSFGKK